MRSLIAAPVLLSVTLAACSGPSPEDVEVRTDRPEYFVPDLAIVTVRNGWNGSVHLGACGILEVRVGLAWTAPVERICTDDLIELRPGHTLQFGHDLIESLAAGTYRFRVPVSPNGAPLEPAAESFVSNRFTVMPKARLQ